MSVSIEPTLSNASKPLVYVSYLQSSKEVAVMEAEVEVEAVAVGEGTSMFNSFFL